MGGFSASYRCYYVHICGELLERQDLDLDLEVHNSHTVSGRRKRKKIPAIKDEVEQKPQETQISVAAPSEIPKTRQHSTSSNVIHL